MVMVTKEGQQLKCYHFSLQNKIKLSYQIFLKNKLKKQI